MSEETIRRQDRGGMLGIEVWSEEDGRYLVACPEHPDTPAVDCLVCEPVNSAEEDAEHPEAGLPLDDDPWLKPAPTRLEPVREERPDDDPAPVAICNGRDCGGRSHG